MAREKYGEGKANETANELKQTIILFEKVSLDGPIEWLTDYFNRKMLAHPESYSVTDSACPHSPATTDMSLLRS